MTNIQCQQTRIPRPFDFGDQARLCERCKFFGGLRRCVVGRFRSSRRFLLKCTTRLLHNNCVAQMAGWLWRHLLQQSGKACLFEVVVAGQSFGQTFAFHHNERDAVGQRPAFVRAASVKSQTSIKEFSGGRDELDFIRSRQHVK